MNLLLTPRSLEGRSDVEAIDPRLAPIFLSGSITSLYFAVALLTALVYHSGMSFTARRSTLLTDFRPQAITLDKEVTMELSFLSTVLIGALLSDQVLLGG